MKGKLEGNYRRPQYTRFQIARWYKLLIAAAVLCLVLGQQFWFKLKDFPGFQWHNKDTDPICPQVGSLYPIKNEPVARELTALYNTDGFRENAIDWLSGAVQVPTESYDEMTPVGQDPRWEAFKPFHEYLENAFPKVHQTLKLTKVNTFGLLFHWQGSDDSRKPILLTAHQDVVPVEPSTVDQWLHPPYSGHYDGKWIWGRGAGDDKSGLIGILGAVESLISKGFTPIRSVVVAFGFDEEASGTQGAGELAKEMLRAYGKDAFSMIVDEGGGYDGRYGTVFAEPAIAEKGYIDVRIEVKTPGGHSSVPPEHTTIGILATLLVEIEKNPITPILARDTLPYATLQCLGAHATKLPVEFKRLIIKSRTSGRALKKLEKLVFRDASLRAAVGTTQAIDLIQGGVKTNALPESAAAIVNHRIATDSSVSATQKHIIGVLAPVAQQYNLSFAAFGEEVNPSDRPSYGSLEISDPWDTALEPAPVTPTGPEAQPYKLLSGTIKATHEASPDFVENNKTIAIIPGVMAGNTDTQFYWDLSKHIFRYGHLDVQGIYNGLHTVNEAITADSFIEMIKFFTTLILNADESTSI